MAHKTEEHVVNSPKKRGAFIYLFLFLFVLLFLLFLPFPFQYLPNIGAHLNKFIEPVIEFVAATFGFAASKGNTLTIASDSLGSQLLVGFLFVLALLIAGFVSLFFKIPAKIYLHLQTSLSILCAYILSVFLALYGFVKMVGLQFYAPDSNILFTPLAYLDRDILYWSTMGVSKEYALFMGLLEIIPAILLLFRPTRILGALIAFGVLTNVIAVNLSFDISVKLLSCFLLLLSFIILLPNLKAMANFFMAGKSSQLKTPETSFIKNRPFYFLLKILVIGIIMLELSAIETKEMGERNNYLWKYDSEIEGAWEVQNDSAKTGIKRIFFNRLGYFITQNARDEMTDYKMLQMDKEGIIECGHSSKENLFIKLDVTTLNDRTFLEIEGTLSLRAYKINLKDLPINQ